MTTNEPGGLYLVLGTENSEPWTFPCKGCEGKGQRLDDVPPYYGAVAVIDCHECKGKGQRRVRVVGKVAVEDQPTTWRGEIKRWYVAGDSAVERQSLDLLAKAIVEGYRADTLPAAVRDGLHQEDCD